MDDTLCDFFYNGSFLVSPLTDKNCFEAQHYMRYHANLETNCRSASPPLTTSGNWGNLWPVAKCDIVYDVPLAQFKLAKFNYNLGKRYAPCCECYTSQSRSS